MFADQVLVILVFADQLLVVLVFTDQLLVILVCLFHHIVRLRPQVRVIKSACLAVHLRRQLSLKSLVAGCVELLGSRMCRASW